MHATALANEDDRLWESWSSLDQIIRLPLSAQLPKPPSATWLNEPAVWLARTAD